MFDKFTEEAVNVIMFAQEESRRLGHNFVGTEQMLLGLIGIDNGVAAKVLKSLGVNLKDTRIEVKKIIGRGSGFVAVKIPFTPRAKRVLELSLEEAHQLGHNYIGTEHLLLGLIEEGEGVAAKVLENLGVDFLDLKKDVMSDFRKEEIKTPDSEEQIKQSDPTVNCKDETNKIKHSDKEIDASEGNDLVSQLERLASLKREGLLTNKEFVEAKRKLLF